MTRVVVATPDLLGTRMAGPAIRALHFAKELARSFDVALLAAIASDYVADASFETIARRTTAAHDAILSADVVISQPTRELLSIRRRAAQLRIYDLFDPVLLELRELYGASPSLRSRLHLFAEKRRMLRALRDADALVIAAPAQRRYYESFRRRADDDWLLVPFGCEVFPQYGEVPDEPPTIVWNGGVWEWLDPVTAVDAVERANASGVTCRLHFMGTRRPSFAAADSRNAAASLQSQYVRWNDDWVPYDERGRWLQRGKLAMMLHRATPEAEFSIRTRLFDAISARLPVIASRGGYAAELVEREGLGIVVEPEDVRAVSNAIVRLLTDDEFHVSCVSNMQRVMERFSWARVTEPLVTRIERWQAHR